MLDGQAGSRSPVSNLTCEDCSFFNSRLSYALLDDFRNPQLVASTVFVEDANEFKPTMSFRTFLDAPVLFVGRDTEENLRNYDRERLEDIDLGSDVQWAFYETGSYCVNEADYNSLQEHLKERDEAARREYNERIAVQDVKEGELLEPVPPLMSDLFVSDFWTVAKFHDTTNTGQRFTKTANYICLLGYEDIEPLLRNKVLDQLKNVYIRWALTQPLTKPNNPVARFFQRLI